MGARLIAHEERQRRAYLEGTQGEQQIDTFYYFGRHTSKLATPTPPIQRQQACHKEQDLSREHCTLEDDDRLAGDIRFILCHEVMRFRRIQDFHSLGGALHYTMFFLADLPAIWDGLREGAWARKGPHGPRHNSPTWRTCCVIWDLAMDRVWVYRGNLLKEVCAMVVFLCLV